MTFYIDSSVMSSQSCSICYMDCQVYHVALDTGGTACGRNVSADGQRIGGSIVAGNTITQDVRGIDTGDLSTGYK